MNPEHEKAWNAYWDEPRLAACMRDEEGNYSGEIAAQWKRFFSTLPDQATVLDIATGNGAVALMALDCSDRLDRAFVIEAIDAAAINPAAALPGLKARLDRITFRGGVSSESLPFDRSTFDAVAGQYALEYTELEKTASEIARVLKPGGQLMFISHSSDSSVFATTVAQLEEIRDISTLDLVRRVQALIDAGQSQPEEVRKERMADFQRHAAMAMQQLDASSGSNRVFISQYLQQLGEIYQQRHDYPHGTTQGKLVKLASDLESHEARLMALRDAALDEPGITAMQVLLRESGFTDIESGPVTDEQTGNRLGHRFTATRLAQAVANDGG